MMNSVPNTMYDCEDGLDLHPQDSLCFDPLVWGLMFPVSPLASTFTFSSASIPTWLLDPTLCSGDEVWSVMFALKFLNI